MDYTKYAGIIFNLFGTLIGDLAGPQYTNVLTHIASALSLPADDFRHMWSNTFHARNAGAFHSVEILLVHICRALSVQPKDDDVKLAAQIRKDYARLIMTRPKIGAVDTLSQLRQRGHKLGLLSDCTPDAPVIWPETPFAPLFNVTVFSCSVGLMKPDHRIYQLIVERLGVESKNCIYVSNGQSGELRGAYEMGMYPVLITPDADEEFLCIPPRDEETALAEQKGAVVSSLAEVLTLVSSSHSPTD